MSPGTLRFVANAAGTGTRRREGKSLNILHSAGPLVRGYSSAEKLLWPSGVDGATVPWAGIRRSAFASPSGKLENAAALGANWEGGFIHSPSRKVDSASGGAYPSFGVHCSESLAFISRLRQTRALGLFSYSAPEYTCPRNSEQKPFSWKE